jgi:hypothetical protein
MGLLTDVETPMVAVKPKKPLTPKAKEKLKLQKQKRKAREAVRLEKRKARRAAKAAPRNALKEWAAEVCKDGKCAVCGCGSHEVPIRRGKRKGQMLVVNNHAHHLLPKERYKSLRLEPQNGVPLCPNHHKYHMFAAHRNPLWFAEWLRVNRPEQYRWAIEHMGAPELEKPAATPCTKCFPGDGVKCPCDAEIAKQAEAPCE